MNDILKASVATLEKSKTLLNNLTDEQLANKGIAPYYSCVGSHIRHILDFYDCTINGISTNKVDLTVRKRDERISSECNYAITNVNRIINEIKKLDGFDLSNTITVIDNLGLGAVEIKYTVSALLAQMATHAIHHYATISYILTNLGVTIKDETFGYNPTTPIAVKN